MDISGIKPIERVIDIKHPATGAPIGIRISVISMNDDRMTKLKRTLTDRRLHLEARNKSFKAEELEENALQLTFHVMQGWEWYNPTGKPGDDGYDADAMPDFHGEIPVFNFRNFKAVDEELYWFTPQIQEGVSEEKDFFDLSK